MDAVQVIDANTLAWRVTANPGLALKPIRENQQAGHYLGLVKFEAFTRSGLHQHQGVATSFVIDGGLTDYHGSIRLHQAGINIKGSTHDAIAYEHTLLVSRLEGPVTYPQASNISGVHSGSSYGDFGSPDPRIPPEINVTVDAQRFIETGYKGVSRQDIFDYTGTGSNHRMAQLNCEPGSSLAFTTTALTEFWLRGGNLSINGKSAHANCFVCIAANTAVEIDAAFGASLIAWAEGAEKRVFGSASDLFGFFDSRRLA